MGAEKVLFGDGVGGAVVRSVIVEQARHRVVQCAVEGEDP
jgi:hypothetical protein